MGWRPDGWDKIVSEDYMHYGGDREIFEEGADAMLKALYKEGGGKWFRLDKTNSEDFLIHVEG